MAKPYIDATKKLVAEVLARFNLSEKEALPDDITNRVFMEIEMDPHLLRRYRALISPDRRDPVNNAIGWEVKAQTRAESIRPSTNGHSGLIGSYRLLRRRQDSTAIAQGRQRIEQ